ncbi:TPR-REGION domain-containing protein [Mycena indigotica]|uniref:TPR-REGION domain-containing protein n=1 Tax=Mycena indigotica TaxID=2126181 RepID=A0A8H6SXQ1_9AGAR|nr:TPR-REGION domain-containing protein [Mycena indigotica]KAF7307356.1 TPR-REGION domain-containing protein [Mycena indigotica]
MADVLKAAADALHRQGNYAQAHWKYSEAIAQTPNNAILYANRAATSLKLADYLGALDDASEATAIDPLYIRGWSRIASAAEKLHYWETARSAYMKALSCLGTETSSLHQQVFRRELESGLASATANQNANLPWDRAVVLNDQNLLKRGTLPSSGWVIAVAAMWFERGYKPVQQLATNPRFAIALPGMAIWFETINRALEGLTTGLLNDKRAFKVDPGFIDKMEYQMNMETWNTHAWTTINLNRIKTEFVQRLGPEQTPNDWNPVRRALAVTVRIWIFKGFIATKRGDHAKAVQHYKRTVEILQWGAAKYPHVHRDDRGAHFEASFIRGVQRLYIPAVIAVIHSSQGSAPGRTLEDIEKLARDLKSDTETCAPFPNIEAEPGFYAPFWIYPIAEGLCYVGWVHKQQGIRHKRNKAASEASKEWSKAAKFYTQAAKAYPEDEEERPFLLFAAFECLCWTGAPLRKTLPLCRQIRDSMQAADVVWDGARLSMAAEQRAANCRRAIAFLADNEKKLADKQLTLEDKSMPTFLNEEW